MKLVVVFALTVALYHGSTAVSTSPSLLKNLQTEEFSKAIIVLKEHVRTIVDGINSKVWINSGEKSTAMAAELRSFTKASQTPIVNFLTQAKTGAIKTFWITNRIYVSKLNNNTYNELTETFANEIEEIRLPYVAHFPHTINGHDYLPRAQLEWGVKNIEAPALWEAGIEGEGIVVSHIDTGVRHTHESLVGALRETHNWLDPYFETDEPSDTQGHGTHTMGSLVGRNGTGVAPKATYITCKGCGNEDCTEEALLKCGQFTLCPTLPDGTGEDCSKKPHISSNSWGGLEHDDFYLDVINAWEAANIIPVFAAGNNDRDPYCRRIGSPADYPNVITVGATSRSNDIAYFSSLGPAFDLRIQPDVSAPGNSIRSAGILHDTQYTEMSGTSMAAPHVAGAIALLLSKDSSLSFVQIEKLFKENSVRPDMFYVQCTQGVNQTYPWPNNMHGWGKIDVSMAANAL